MKATINLELLLNAREENGFSISDLANELGYKTPTGYWLLEKGQRKISVEVLYRLSKLYGRTMEEFIVEK
jgi:transcriptional regulator with XRE-family HTH domain